MSEITVKGTVETVLPTQEFDSGFKKRVLVINTGGDYPQQIPVEFVKDKVNLLDSLQPGTEVTAHINLRGNEYKGKYYANIQGWRLEEGEAKAKPEPVAASGGASDGEDIPFSPIPTIL